MALWHTFEQWHLTVKALTSKAKKTPPAQYYMIYSSSPGRKLSYLLFESHEQLETALLQTLDTKTEVHRVGETGQLTGKKSLFAWDSFSEPSDVLWAVVTPTIKRFKAGGYEVGASDVDLYSRKQILIGRGKTEPAKLAISSEPVRSIPLMEAIRFEFDEEAGWSYEAQYRNYLGMVNAIAQEGVVEHRWFGVVDMKLTLNHISQSNAPYEANYLHDILLGDTDFS